MAQIIETPLVSSSARGSLPLLIGTLIGLVSAAGFAWDGRVGVDVVSEILLARDSSPFTTVGERLVWISWCPLGFAVGDTLVTFGLRRAARQHGLSLACVGLMALYGVFAVSGAVAVWYGTDQVRSVVFEVLASVSAINGGEVNLATAEATVLVYRGWLLLAVAHVALLAACFAQVASCPRFALAKWPAVATVAVALIPLWLFAASVSSVWIYFGLTFQEYATASGLDIPVVIAQINRVILIGWFGSGLLVVHATLATILAVIAIRATSQRPSAVFRRSQLPRLMAWYAPWTWKWRWWVAAVLLLVFVEYPLSIGPIHGLWHLGWLPMRLRALYFPIQGLAYFIPAIDEWLNWYLDLFIFHDN